MNWTEWLSSYCWIIFIVLFLIFNVSRLKTFRRLADSRKKTKDPTLTSEKLRDPVFLKECVRQEPILIEMKRQLDKIMQQKADFIPVYGYRMKEGILGTTVYNYMFGFNPELSGFLIVQISSEIIPLDYPYLVDETRAESIKYMLDGSLKVTFPNGETVAIIISPFMAEDSEDLGLINITQTEIVMSFRDFLKSNYNV